MSLDLNEIYVDNAATTPVTEEVLNEMLPYFTKSYGNPSGLYMLSQESKAAIELSLLNSGARYPLYPLRFNPPAEWK